MVVYHLVSAENSNILCKNCQAKHGGSNLLCLECLSVSPIFIVLVLVLADPQGIQRWRFHIDPPVDTCLDRPLLCEIPCCCKSRKISSIIYKMQLVSLHYTL